MNSEMKDWSVVQSKRGKDSEFGFPIGDILVRKKEDIQKVIKEKNILDPVITPYSDFEGN
jgi:hypothetical protein